MKRRKSHRLPTAPTLGALCALVCGLIAPSGAQATTQTFSYTGAEQTFTVPAGVTSLDVLAIGGRGGNASKPGGVAAEVTGTVSVSPGQTLYVEVGGNGAAEALGGGGGFNGGGQGGGGGGGASDIRTLPLASGLSPDDRLVVAGGGGGGGAQGSEIGGAGGAAGAAGETVSNEGGGAGTSSSGGSGGSGGCTNGSSGQLGVGGNAGSPCSFSGGGGGGGLYGGGGGGSGLSVDGGGGGGGSSLVPAGGTSTLGSSGTEPQVQVTYVAPTNPPTVVTEAATAVKQTSATLNATVDPEGSTVTSCFFEYGTSPAYGSTAPCSPSPGSGVSPVAVSAAIAGLSPQTTYDFRIVATNAHGTSQGGEQTFTTPPNPPAVVTGAASSITHASATLNATVDPEASNVTVCFFEYGKSLSYGSTAPCGSLPGSGTSPVAVSAAISGLKASTTEHFRIVAGNAGGVSAGADQRFTTAPPEEELPEIGRCVKLGTPTGKYQSANCTSKSAGESTGFYEWRFEPGTARAFTFKNGAATLETVGKAKIKCLENTYSGNYTGSKTATVHMKLTGCEPVNSFGIKCQSNGAHAGEVNFNTLEGHLGFINAAGEPTVGMELNPTALQQPYVARFHCGEVPVSITGSVIASYTTVNKMVAAFTVSFKATAGIQTPEAFEGGAANLLYMTSGESARERTGLSAADKASNQESLEIKASS